MFRLGLFVFEPLAAALLSLTDHAIFEFVHAIMDTKLLVEQRLEPLEIRRGTQGERFQVRQHTGVFFLRQLAPFWHLGQFLGRLLQALGAGRDLPLSESLAVLLGAVESWIGGTVLADDVSALAVEWLAPDKRHALPAQEG